MGLGLRVGIDLRLWRGKFYVVTLIHGSSIGWIRRGSNRKGKRYWWRTHGIQERWLNRLRGLGVKGNGRGAG
ncbi:hypothetical protein BDZ91DRAFT_722348 [Kalaharituber pfeilii]|nr:hypothetical protein BDZ91DRAFT_722348 [Kalaharituber pfeilii]